MTDVFICDAIRTPVGRYGGCLAAVRTDDLAAIPIRALLERNPGLDPGAVDDVLLGCANQAGEDNRNVARMALLLAGLPASVPGVTVNRLCSSGLNAIAAAANAIQAGEGELMIAGGVESMSRAPFVIGKAGAPFDRAPKMEDTTMGWRFVNPRLDAMYGTETMPKTAENLAEEYGISREDQDAFALWSQQKAAAAQADGSLAGEIVPVEVPRRKQDPLVVDTDEHPRIQRTDRGFELATSLESLAKLRPAFRPGGTVTAGNASTISDGAAFALLASEAACAKHGLKPKARMIAYATNSLHPDQFPVAPIGAIERVCAKANITLDQIDLFEVNTAFSAVALMSVNRLKLDRSKVNINGGAISIGHPVGASGGRLVATLLNALEETGGRYGLTTLCIGGGEAVAAIFEKV